MIIKIKNTKWHNKIQKYFLKMLIRQQTLKESHIGIQIS